MEPTREAWAKLYDIAMKIKKQKPWKWMDISDIFAIEDPVTKVNFYCSVQSDEQADYVQLLVGEDGLNRIVGLLESISRGSEYWEDGEMEDEINGLAAYMLGFDEHSLNCYFTSKSHLSPYELEVLENMGLSFRGAKQWIAFKSIKPGQLTEAVHDAESVRIMTLLLEQLYDICTREKKEPVIRDWFHEGSANIYRWYYSPQSAQWQGEFVDMDAVLGQLPVIQYTNQLKVAKVRHLKGSRQVYELLRIYMPVPVEHGDCLLFPLTFLLVDMSNGMVVWSLVDEGAEGYEERLLEQLADFFVHEGRKPSRILTADYVLHQIIADFCDRCKIFVEYLAYTVTGDEILESFMETTHLHRDLAEEDRVELDKKRNLLESILVGPDEAAKDAAEKAKPSTGGVIIDFRTGKPIE